jgi:hypothetical protein
VSCVVLPSGPFCGSVRGFAEIFDELLDGAKDYLSEGSYHRVGKSISLIGLS